MTISLKHAFTSPVTDQGNPDEVGPDEWNAEHTLTQAADRILGRVTAGAGATEELTAAQVRTLINVEDGATADQSAAEILAALLTVDGTGTGLDADLLDGNEASAFATAAQGALADSALQSSDIGTSVQAWDAQLDSLSSASANGVSLVTAASYAAMRGLLDLEAGTDFYSIAAADAAFQPLDSDLTAIAALTTQSFGRALLEDASAADTRDALDAAPYVASRTALKALDTSKDTVAYLKEAGREGWFKFDSSDLSSEVTTDTAEGVYVPPDSDATGASGAWVRSDWKGDVWGEWFGAATGNTAATNTTALNGAIAFINAYGGDIRLGAGTFAHNALNTITANGGGIVGSGIYVTVLDAQHTTGNSITLTTSADQKVKALAMTCSVIKTSGYAIVCSSSAYEPDIDVRIDYHYDGIFIQDASEAKVKANLRYLLGTRGIYYGGTVGNGCFGASFDLNCNNPYPGDNDGTRTSWATSTAYSLDDIIYQNGFIWQCTTAGTSAGSGSGPAAVPGTGGSSCFTTAVTDGTAAWKLVARAIHWFHMDSYAYSARIKRGSALLNGYRSIFMDDSAASGSSYPVWLWFDGESDHAYENSVYLFKGKSFYGTGAWVGSSLTGRGVIIDSGFQGDVSFDPGSRIAGNWLDGVLLQAGPVNCRFLGALIEDNSQAASGTYHGINVGSTASYFIVSGCRITGSRQGYAVIVPAAASDRYIITNNVVQGNATGGISDGGTGSNKTVSGNVT